MPSLLTNSRVYRHIMYQHFIRMLGLGTMLYAMTTQVRRVGILAVAPASVTNQITVSNFFIKN